MGERAPAIQGGLAPVRRRTAVYELSKRLLRRTGARLIHDRRSLSIFLFHVIFADAAEADRGDLAPQQRITVEDFRTFVRHYKQHGYQFVTPEDVLRGLPPDGRFVMTSFDDGYYNNLRALPVLREFSVPAVFFIATGFVKQNKCYWWDVLYRERRRRGADSEAIIAESRALKQGTPQEIEDHLRNTFGQGALDPVGDLDRPMTPDELRELSQEPLACIGNHTVDHAILPNLDAHGIRAQIRGCQRDLGELCGVSPRAIAYPNGDHSDEVTAVCRSAGMQLGITVEKGKTYLPLAPQGDQLLRLKRFTLWGGRDIDQQCATCRSDFSWAGLRAGRSRAASS